MELQKHQKMSVETNKMLECTQEDFDKNLFAIKGAIGAFTGLEIVTNPKCCKKVRDTKEAFNSVITKVTEYASVLTHVGYKERVKNQLIKEGKDVSEYQEGENTNPLTFGPNNEIVGVNKYGRIQLEYLLHEKSFPTKRPHTTWYMDGQLINKEVIPDVLPKVSKATNQGTTQEIKIRKVNTCNIRRITIGGITLINTDCNRP